MRLVSYMSEGSGEPRFGRVVTDGAVEGVVDGVTATDGRFRSVREVLAAERSRSWLLPPRGVPPTCRSGRSRCCRPSRTPRRSSAPGSTTGRTWTRPGVRTTPTHAVLPLPRHADRTRPARRAAGGDEPVRLRGRARRRDRCAGGPRAQADAAQVVAGYSCYDDLSVRDWQRHASQFLPARTSGPPVASDPGWSRRTRSTTSPPPRCGPGSTASCARRPRSAN